jgi:hypothetical protein
LLDRRVFAVAIVQLQHLRNTVGDLCDLDEEFTLEAKAREDVIPVGVGRVVGMHLVERERDGPGDLVEVEAHLAAIALDHHPGVLADGPIQQLGAMDTGNGLRDRGFDPR